jgi:predicted metal-dependent hydrolase
MTSVAYRVQVSSRARYPRLKMSARDGLVVLVPTGFDQGRVPSVIARKRDWIRRTEERLQDQVKFLVPKPPGTRPERIALRAIGEEWSVSYRQTDGMGVTGVERRGSQLLLFGDLEDEAAVGEALIRWLSRKTREHIVPRLIPLGGDRGIAVTGVTIRCQRTRWASCSRTGRISLNVRLLFVPRELVRYALLHELAHIREMNHSRRYWALLSSIEPDARVLDSELRAAWRLVPEWIRPAR